MNDSLDVSTIIFAALAVFVVWKLRSVLGTRTGEERPPFNPFNRRTGGEPGQGGTAPETGKVIPLPTNGRATSRPGNDADRWKGIAEPNSRLASDLDRIAAADPSFTGAEFLGGAKAAYEMILAAFAKGDRATLQTLLAKDVLEGFTAAIADREARGEAMDHALVALDTAKITQAELVGDTAQVTVLFESQQINVVRDRQGAATAGGSESVVPVVDQWTFAHAVKARDPNWTLIATHAE